MMERISFSCIIHILFIHLLSGFILFQFIVFVSKHTHTECENSVQWNLQGAYQFAGCTEPAKLYPNLQIDRVTFPVSRLVRPQLMWMMWQNSLNLKCVLRRPALFFMLQLDSVYLALCFSNSISKVLVKCVMQIVGEIIEHMQLVGSGSRRYVRK